jgi:hypothetical protein
MRAVVVTVICRATAVTWIRVLISAATYMLRQQVTNEPQIPQQYFTLLYRHLAWPGVYPAPLYPTPANVHQTCTFETCRSCDVYNSMIFYIIIGHRGNKNRGNKIQIVLDIDDFYLFSKKHNFLFLIIF